MKILLLDIETKPHLVTAWGLFDQRIGINQILEAGSTLCFAAKWMGKREIIFESVYQTTERKMLKTMHDLLDEADAVVTYNGKRFDLPTLNKEFVLHGMKPPAPYKSIDLYQTVKRQFRWASNKLDYVSQSLGLGSKTQHKGMELWLGCMNNDPSSWSVMERYNRQDVRLLEKLYLRLLPWIKDHPNHALYDLKEKPACTNCGSENLQRRGYALTKVGRYARMQCKGCGHWMRSRTSEKMSPEERSTILVRDAT